MKKNDNNDIRGMLVAKRKNTVQEQVLLSFTVDLDKEIPYAMNVASSVDDRRTSTNSNELKAPLNQIILSEPNWSKPLKLRIDNEVRTDSNKKLMLRKEVFKVKERKQRKMCQLI